MDNLELAITQLQVKQFRCLTNTSLSFDNKLVLITGCNGTGKTSILEALHYGCYLRSFRTHLPRELIHFDADSFFLKIDLTGIQRSISFDHAIQVGFSHNKKVVKLDQKPIQSYKELTDFYRVITVAEDDLQFIKGTPDKRRLFIDQALILLDADYITLARTYRTILESRNHLLATRAPASSLSIWTQQLFDTTHAIQHKRVGLVRELEKTINALLDTWFEDQISITLEYKPKHIKLEESYTDSLDQLSVLHGREAALGRSLFGAHLDDIAISFCDKKSKSYASRGQQKLVVLLLHCAFLLELKKHKGGTILLLDDFMADFDQKKGETLIELLSDLNSQIIFTSPSQESSFDRNLLTTNDAQHIVLTE